MIENMDFGKILKKLHANNIALHILTSNLGDNSIMVTFIFTTRDYRLRWEYCFALSELYMRNDGRLDRIVDEAIKQLSRKGEKND